MKKIGFVIAVIILTGHSLAVSAQNNVGIGTNNPQEKLHVVGDVRVDSLQGTDNRLLGVDATGKLINMGSMLTDTTRLILRDSTGDIRFIFDANEASLQMLDDDTVWYKQVVASPFTDEMTLPGGGFLRRFILGKHQITQYHLPKKTGTGTYLARTVESYIGKPDPGDTLIILHTIRLTDESGCTRYEKTTWERLPSEEKFTIEQWYYCPSGNIKYRRELTDDAKYITQYHETTGNGIRWFCDNAEATFDVRYDSTGARISGKRDVKKGVSRFGTANGQSTSNTESIDNNKHTETTKNDTTGQKIRVIKDPVAGTVNATGVKEVIIDSVSTVVCFTYKNDNNFQVKVTIDPSSGKRTYEAPTGDKYIYENGSVRQESGTTNASTQKTVEPDGKTSFEFQSGNDTTRMVVDPVLRALLIDANTLVQGTVAAETLEVVNPTNPTDLSKLFWVEALEALEIHSTNGADTPRIRLYPTTNRITINSDTSENVATGKFESVTPTWELKNPQTDVFYRIKIDTPVVIHTWFFGPDTVKKEVDVAQQTVTIKGTKDVTGNVNVGGNLNVVGSKNFRIDHPLDEENKYLVHAAIEGPERMNMYNGIIETDESGFATIALPDYFMALNKDFRYQLTVMGKSFAQAIVYEEITDGEFTIRTSSPSVQVNWQVMGTRKDKYARDHPFEVEVDKERHRGDLLYHE